MHRIQNTNKTAMMLPAPAVHSLEVAEMDQKSQTTAMLRSLPRQKNNGKTMEKTMLFT